MPFHIRASERGFGLTEAMKLAVDRTTSSIAVFQAVSALRQLVSTLPRRGAR
jgi:hypothetical protein